MEAIFERTRMLLGNEAMKRLEESHVLVLGLGGVGGSACETLVRSGIGEITIVDMDIITESNINRQIIATTKTLGMKKTEAMKERLLSINPLLKVNVRDEFILDENVKEIIGHPDFVLDCIDTVTAKINVASYCFNNDINLISSMGAGNKLNPLNLEITDIYKTSVCPLAKVLRRELKARGVEKLTVIYSKETPVRPINLEEGVKAKESGSKGEIGYLNKKRPPGSCAFVPPVAGIIMAGYVIKKLSKV